MVKLPLRGWLAPAGLWLMGVGLLTGCAGTPTPLAPGLRGSIGLPHHGVLTGGATLPPDGYGFARYRPAGDRNYGTPSLVGAIERAAKQVADRFSPSPKLLVGDLSAKTGGKITGHASHRSGRDVDLLYYTITLDQVPVTSPGFVHFGPDSLARLPSGAYVALDIPRQWALTRALLTDPEIDVLWMFVSRDVEAYLIDYAMSLGEAPELCLKAERVLHQPRDSANHDDHLHVRIGCSPVGRVDGCEPGGPAWPWIRAGADADMALVDPQSLVYDATPLAP